MSEERKTYGYMDVPRHQAIQRQRGVTLEVFLNGAKVSNVVTANDEKGFIVRQKTTPEGKLVVIGNEVQHERLEGSVEFRPKEETTMGYAAVKCFLVEPTDTVKLFARCFVASGGPDAGKCEQSGFTYHNAEVFYKDIESPLTKQGYDVSEPEKLPEDAPFPTHCVCGFEFRPQDRTIFTSRVYRRTDSGETLTFTDVHKAPGAMYRATWCEDHKPWCGPDGRSYIVVLPNGREWQIDGRASNCTMPNDNEHKCWVRHGEAPEFTVDKNGNTCAAGGGSILAGDYHGFLQNGWLTAGS